MGTRRTALMGVSRRIFFLFRAVTEDCLIRWTFILP